MPPRELLIPWLLSFSVLTVMLSWLPLSYALMRLRARRKR